MDVIELGAKPTGSYADSVTVSALFPNVPILTAPPDAIAALVDRIMGNAAHTALVYLSDVLAEQVPHDTGDLANSFRSDPATTLGGIELTGVTFVGDELVGRVFSDLPYAAVMDAGRRPGAPVNRAGLDAIALWAERKLGLTAEEAQRAKWAIAATITARGIEPHDYADDALRIADTQLGVIFAHAGDALAEALASQPGLSV